MNQTQQQYCIVTEEDVVLEDQLTLRAAEELLCYYLNMGEDAYIGESAN